MENRDKYCSSCASPLEMKETNGALRPVCPSCGNVVYYDPKVVAVAIVARESEVLLIRRAGQPQYGLWSVPGGYVDRGEVVEQAACREVLEETGLLVTVDGLLGLYSEGGQPIIVAAFTAVECGGQLAAGPEALEVGFFGLDKLPPLAFPGDTRILENWSRSRKANG